MDAERWQRIRKVLEVVFESPLEKRSELLDIHCGEDLDLRQMVDSLIAAHDEAGRFLEPSRTPGLPSTQSGFGSPFGEEQRIGPYRTKRRIGRGGMGDVFLAVRDDGVFEQQVALKVAHWRLDGEDGLRRFRQERQILANLEHGSIARIHDGGKTDDGRPFLVMEYVDGVAIDRYCDEQRCSVKERIVLFQKVCSAVQAAHRNLIVHRDLKPANVLVRADGVPKLIDFGIAKFLKPDPSDLTLPATVTGFRAMTPVYASPEQVRGEQITTVSDVYSLGVLLYELLAGERPYQLTGCDLGEIGRVVCEQEPKRPSMAVEQSADNRLFESYRENSMKALAQRLRGDLDTIVLCALQKDPGRRYASVERFSEDLRRELTGMPVLAQEDTFAYRAVKFIRRNWLATGIGIILVFLVAGLGLQSTRLSEALVQAKDESSRAQALLARQYWQDAQRAVLDDKWIEAAHLFVKSVMLSPGEDSQRSGLQSIWGLVGNLELVDVLPGESAKTNGSAQYPRASSSLRQNQRVFGAGEQIFLVRLQDWVELRSVDDGAPAAPPVFHQGVQDAEFTSDGKHLVTVARKTGARLWNLDGSAVIPGLAQDDSCFTRLTEDQTLVLVSCGEDAKIWNRDSEQFLAPALLHPGLADITTSPGRNRILTWSRDGRARLWNSDGSSSAGPFFDSGGSIVNVDDEGIVLVQHLGREGLSFQLWDALTGKARSGRFDLGGRHDSLVWGFFDGYKRHLAWQYSLGPQTVSIRSLEGPQVSRIDLSYRGVPIVLPNERQLLILGRSAMHLVDASTGQTDTEVNLQTSGGATFLGFSPDGTLFTLAGPRNLMALRSEDLEQWSPEIENWFESDFGQISADNRYLLAGSRDGHLGIWNREIGAPWTPVLQVGGGAVTVSASRELTTILTTHDHELATEIRLWHLDLDFPLLYELDAEHNVWQQEGIDLFSPDGYLSEVKRMSRVKNGRFEIWNLDRNPAELASQSMAQNYLVNQPERTLGMSWNHNLLSVRRLEDANELVSDLGHDSQVRAASFGPGQHRVTSWTTGRKVNIWSLESGQRVVPAIEHETEIGGVEWCDDAEKILVWGQEGISAMLRDKAVVLNVWDIGDSVAELDHSMRIGTGTHQANQEVLLGGDCSFVVVSSALEVKVWSLVDGSIRELPLTDARANLGRIHLRFSPDGKTLALWSAGLGIQLWDTETWSRLGPTMNLPRKTQGIEFSPDGRLLASWSDDNSIRLWQIPEGKELGQPAYTDRTAFGVRFSSDGRRLLSWSNDGAVRIWRTEDFSRIGRTLRNESGLAGAMFGQKGQTVLSWGRDEMVRLWDISADYDFPREHLGLLVEAITGTVLDDVDTAVPLTAEEWRKRRIQYLQIAESHAKSCSYPDANLYLRSRSTRAAQQSDSSDP